MKEDGDATELVVVEKKGVDSGTSLLHLETCSEAAPPDVEGETTPKSKRRESSPIPPRVPLVGRGRRGFAPVCQDVLDVETIGGERMQYDTRDMTTADLRIAVAMRRGVASSQVQLFCGEKEVSDESPVLSGQLSVAFRQVSELPEML